MQEEIAKISKKLSLMGARRVEPLLLCIRSWCTNVELSDVDSAQTAGYASGKRIKTRLTDADADIIM